jgi:hypothetical protein
MERLKKSIFLRKNKHHFKPFFSLTENVTLKIHSKRKIHHLDADRFENSSRTFFTEQP